MSARITHLDTARGVAVLGILGMNAVQFGLGGPAYYDLTAGGTHSALDWIAGVLGEVFIDQKFMGLFSLLFGASVLLFLDRVQGRTARPAGLSLWRNALLLGIGVLHGALWVGDILMIYALCAPLLLLFRRASARTLIGLGLVVFSGSIASQVIAGTYGDDASISTAWNDLSRAVEPGLVMLCIIVDLFARSIGMMLVGMGLYRSGWLTRPDGGWGVRGSLVAIGVGAAFAGAGVGWTAAHDFAETAVMHGNAFNGVATVPMTLGYLGVLMWWDRRSKSRWLERARAAGRMALTNYLAQTVISMSLMLLIPASWVSRSTLWLAIPIIWWAQLVLSEAWLARFRMGPVEWLWRCATYRRWSPLRRSSPKAG